MHPRAGWAALALVLVGCGDKDTAEDDTTSSDDTAETGDDTAEPACVGDWEPLSVIEADTWFTDHAVVGSRVLVAEGEAVRLFDYVDPAAPVELVQLDLGGPVVDLSASGWGFLAAVGQDSGSVELFAVRDQGGWQAEPLGSASATLVLAWSGGRATVVEDALKYGTLADDEPGSLEFSPPFTWLTDAIEVDGTFFVSGGDHQLAWGTAEDELARSATARDNPRSLMAVPEGILVAQTGNFWQGCTSSLALLVPSSGEVRHLADAPCISAADGEDGAFQAALVGDVLVVANMESGLLRADWSLDRLRVAGPTTLDRAAWPDGPLHPSRVNTIGADVVLVGDSGRLGAVRVCP